MTAFLKRTKICNGSQTKPILGETRKRKWWGLGNDKRVDRENRESERKREREGERKERER